MTTDYLTACLDACDLARRTKIAYVYKLRSGHYYISASPPGFFSARYIASAYPTIPGGEPSIHGGEQ